MLFTGKSPNSENAWIPTCDDAMPKGVQLAMTITKYQVYEDFQFNHNFKPN